MTIDLHTDPMNLMLPTRQIDVLWERLVDLDLGHGLYDQNPRP
ncbi:MAG: hypothetical protein R2706_07570 [Acidimicrobiales bacterium]